ncbi:hypothetical protein Y032_0050g2014 [Ancylostoma ceylanicum]|uniref:Uncharacterized protein n=1 Tax=Ancylostoma ceylanicum TaxID=53326 RepID=A0A016U9N1_9BILA|nr:hypothetical protein Y032_0050g2014 [Ancylostoma ceylanicum]
MDLLHQDPDDRRSSIIRIAIDDVVPNNASTNLPTSPECVPFSMLTIHFATSFSNIFTYRTRFACNA